MLHRDFIKPLLWHRVIPNQPLRYINMKVTLNGTTLAESADTIVVENNHYFPPASVDKTLFSDSDTQ